MLRGKLLPELIKMAGQTQIKVEHGKGAPLILELLSLSERESLLYHIWGKRVQCVQTAECDVGAMVD